jgi:hypothetical protein
VFRRRSNRVRQLALERLERCEGKLSRTVLGGGSGREAVLLPDSSAATIHCIFEKIGGILTVLST